MGIPVTCPSCLTRFNVSDKFAGKSGPCPKCQKTIQIPAKSEEVVIHAPEETAATDSKGRSVLKPLRRKEVSLSLPVMLAAGLGTLVVFGVALGMGLSGQQPPNVLLGLGAVVLAVPCVLIGYWFLHDDELQGYGGKALLVRGGVCSAAFAATWALYGFIPAYVSGYDAMAQITGLEMAIFILLMIVLGTIVAIAALELELLQGLLHYMFYFVITFTLAWLSGAQLSSPLSNGAAAAAADVPPAVSVPAGEPPKNTPPASPSEPVKKIPNLLQ